ncbi:type II secretion system protein [Sulfurimonas sp.]|uniref:type II secretion system protein n=1 Tax=Sulfurimonas sp. TaxID=2022749 RepID=UPI0025FE4BB6|nr:type II secretion system protein [Sulfurimonas sp.]MBT5934701.1 type II secretion system protein [Sulfurimonas sp.]
MVKRSAFTLIELIFAIVIIAISVVSLPMMNQAISEGIDENIKQEAIFAAATKLNEAVTAQWDEQSLEANQINSLSRVIDINANCNNNPNAITFGQMPGHINQPFHRRCRTAAAGALNQRGNVNITSLDDMAGTTPLFIVTGAGTVANQSSYKENYNSVVTVTQTPNFDGAALNDMKRVDVNITDTTSGATVVSLTTYSANIGAPDFYKRQY